MAAFVGLNSLPARRSPRGGSRLARSPQRPVAVVAKESDFGERHLMSQRLLDKVYPRPSTESIGLRFGSSKLRVFGGTGNARLLDGVADYLGKERGPDAVIHKRFSDGENYVRLEESVRGCDVFLVQSTCSPVNDNLMELMLMIDACRRAHAGQITAVLPYYGYARADRIDGNEALSSKLIANMITKVGADRVIVMDMHSPQSCGFFDIPVDHVHGSPALINYMRRRVQDDIVIVSPDVGGVARARSIAKAYHDAPLAIIDKRRSEHNVAEAMNVVGDVKGKTAIMVDDMIDTAGTICAGARVLKEHGAKSVYGMATHAVLSGPAISRLSEPGLFDEVVVTDTIPVPEDHRFEQLRVVSVAQLLGDAIWKVHEDYSITFR